MKSLKKNYHLLHVLSKATPTQRRAILKTANKNQIDCLCELCLNALEGNLKVNVQKLTKYRTTLRKIAKKPKKFEERKRLLLHQTGGFLPLIIPAALSLLANIFNKSE